MKKRGRLITRRKFLYLAGISSIPLIFPSRVSAFGNNASEDFGSEKVDRKESEGQRKEKIENQRKEKARNIAGLFLDGLKHNYLGNIKHIGLPYTAHIKGDANVNLSAKMTLDIKGDNYRSELDVTDVKGEDSWDGFKLFIGRIFQDQRVKELYNAIATTFVEEGEIEEGRFLTRRLEQSVKGEKSIELIFSNGKVRFYKGAERKDCGNKEYRNHTGPLAGFWRLVLFDEFTPEIRKYIVNPFEGSELRLDTAIIKRNGMFPPASYSYTTNSLFFQNHRFSILGGEPILELASCMNGHNLNIPYFIFVPEVISSSKKLEKQEKQKRLMDDKNKSKISDREYQGKLDEIDKIDIVSARNVNVYLDGFNIDYK